MTEFTVDHAARSVEPSNGVSKVGEHALCDINIAAGLNPPFAKWLDLIMAYRNFGFGRPIFVILLVSLFPLALNAAEKSIVDRSFAELIEGAKKEGRLVVWDTTRGRGKEHFRAFEKKYPFIKVEQALEIGRASCRERV